MTENELLETFAKNVRRLRFNRGWSQTKLAETINLSTNFISDIETCKGWVSPSTLVRLASAFNVKVPELFTSENDKANEVQQIMGRLTDDVLCLVREIKNVMKQQDG